MSALSPSSAMKHHYAAIKSEEKVKQRFPAVEPVTGEDNMFATWARQNHPARFNHLGTYVTYLRLCGFLHRDKRPQEFKFTFYMRRYAPAVVGASLGILGQFMIRYAKGNLCFVADKPFSVLWWIIMLAYFALVFSSWLGAQVVGHLSHIAEVPLPNKFVSCYDEEDEKEKPHETLISVVGHLDEHFVQRFGSRVVWIIVILWVLVQIVAEALGYWSLSVGNAQSWSTTCLVTMGFGSFLAWIAVPMHLLAFLSLLGAEVHLCAQLLERFTHWVKEQIKIWMVTTSAKRSKLSLDFVLRERLLLQSFILSVCKQFQNSITILLVLSVLWGTFCSWMVFRKVDIWTNLIGVFANMVGSLLLLSCMAWLNSGDKLVNTLRDLRCKVKYAASEPHVHGTDSVHGSGASQSRDATCTTPHIYSEEQLSNMRSQLDSLISHVSTTPLGFTLFDVPVTFSLVKALAAAFVPLLTTLNISNAN